MLALNWACRMRGHFGIYLGIHERDVRLRDTSSIRLRLDSPERLHEQLDRVRPDIIVHAAALTNVDECERSPDEAMHINVELAENVASVARSLGVKLVHISTDHVFDGRRAWCSEDDVPHPLNTYAASKLGAEERVGAIMPDALIIRTNFFGWGHARRQSFTDWIIHSLRHGSQITMFDDVYFTPILADRLAEYAHALIDKGQSGIFNIVGDERLSKYEFGLKVADAFGLPRERITRGHVAQSALVAQRPKDLSLTNTKAKKVLMRDFGNVAQYLTELRQQELDKRAAELLNAVTG